MLKAAHKYVEHVLYETLFRLDDSGNKDSTQFKHMIIKPCHTKTCSCNKQTRKAHTSMHYICTYVSAGNVSRLF